MAIQGVQQCSIGHADKCLIAHGRINQARLQFQLSDAKSSEVILDNFKYDHVEMKSLISHYLLANELVYRHIESFIFDMVMRTTTPYR